MLRSDDSFCVGLIVLAEFGMHHVFSSLHVTSTTSFSEPTVMLADLSMSQPIWVLMLLMSLAVLSVMRLVWAACLRIRGVGRRAEGQTDA